MKTKKYLPACALTLASIMSAQADLTFTAPGMDVPYVTTEQSKSWSTSLGTHWKYIINGYNYHLNAGIPVGGKVKGNGQLSYKTGNAQFPGATNVTAMVNGQTISSGSLNAHNINDSTGQISHTFNPPIILTEQSITPSFTMSTNMIGSSDYISIRGSALAAPPTPIGVLIAPHYVRDGGSPTLEWFITKSLEGAGASGAAETPNSTQNESSNSGEGQSHNGDTSNGYNDGPVDGGTSDGSTSTDGTTTDGTSDNGHGNNLDGIDSSNPGKSAAKWAQKGFYDTDYNGDGVAEDDEGHGGGSAISQNKNSNP